ncbi:MAG: prepilin-type N-terminal cleavage/methylation domain-containing protein [Candidatus Omnitrophota bacterium]
MMRRNRKGFTLVEIMIVVAIIALLAAIAIPNLLSAKRTANTAAAKANIRALSTAAEVYATGHDGSYPVDVAAITPYISAAPAICEVAGGAQGYVYSCAVAPGAMGSGGYTFVATPITLGTTGDTTFTVITGGVITQVP